LAKATLLLDRLESEIPFGEEPLKQRLELVRVGAIPYNQVFDAMVSDAIAKAEEHANASTQALAAKIVEETLADLGYDVAPIEETLFVNGGKAYFRKAGWKDYCVRLTVRPEESKMNFNVVRLGGEAAASRESDVEAENAWCSGYQLFVETLASRGLETELTRHLPVGAVPVQAVSSDEVSLSAFGPSTTKRKMDVQAKTRGGNGR
jgi:hypothetical protein